MRQAGRYLPEYRAVRETVSFAELCRTPKLIAEVVRQPVHRFGLDAAILFSDILTPLEPLGLKVEFPEGGPVIGNPVRTPADLDRLKSFDVTERLGFVMEGIREIKRVLPDTPVIGFAGSPFTVACYVIQGSGSKHFSEARQFLHRYPDAGKRLFATLSEMTTSYLQAQIDAGADAVQVFESWGGILSREDFRTWSSEPVASIFRALSSSRVPRIYYVNNVAPYIDIVRDAECEVVGVDHRIDLAQAAGQLSGKSVQGNLDPSALFDTPGNVAARVKRILDSLERHDNVVFNLGHGIQPNTPVESVEALVKAVHEYRS
jgi:uroporphyrinogen decarboxylase